MLEFGKGKVDFAAVFAELKRAGFNGPVMVECCAQGDTPEIVTESAQEPGVLRKGFCRALKRRSPPPRRFKATARNGRSFSPPQEAIPSQ